jgi:hypothetical protein
MCVKWGYEMGGQLCSGEGSSYTSFKEVPFELRCSLVVEHVFCMCQALDSIPHTQNSSNDKKTVSSVHIGIPPSWWNSRNRVQRDRTHSGIAVSSPASFLLDLWSVSEHRQNEFPHAQNNTEVWHRWWGKVTGHVCVSVYQITEFQKVQHHVGNESKCILWGQPCPKRKIKQLFILM